jgi:hypothetical protein
MPQTAFKPAIPVFEWCKTVTPRTPYLASVIGRGRFSSDKNNLDILSPWHLRVWNHNVYLYFGTTWGDAILPEVSCYEAQVLKHV